MAYPDWLRKTSARYAATGVTLRCLLADAADDVAGLWTFTRTCGCTPVFAPCPTPCAKARGRVTVNHRGTRYAARGVP